MKNYIAELEKHGLSAQTLEQLALRMESRAKALGFSHPNSVYHALALDLTLGAIDTMKDSQESLGKTHTAEQWLAIISGEPLA